MKRKNMSKSKKQIEKELVKSALIEYRKYGSMDLPDDTATIDFIDSLVGNLVLLRTLDEYKPHRYNYVLLKFKKCEHDTGYFWCETCESNWLWQVKIYCKRLSGFCPPYRDVFNYDDKIHW
jgi:hypothetical protein